MFFGVFFSLGATGTKCTRSITLRWSRRYCFYSVADPDPHDPWYVFRPSGSVSQWYGSGSFLSTSKKSTVFWLLYVFCLWQNEANVPSKSTNKQKSWKNNHFLLPSWRSLTKLAGSGSVSHRYVPAARIPLSNNTILVVQTVGPRHLQTLGRRVGLYWQAVGRGYQVGCSLIKLFTDSGCGSYLIESFRIWKRLRIEPWTTRLGQKWIPVNFMCTYIIGLRHIFIAFMIFPDAYVDLLNV